MSLSQISPFVQSIVSSLLIAKLHILDQNCAMPPSPVTSLSGSVPDASSYGSFVLTWRHSSPVSQIGGERLTSLFLKSLACIGRSFRIDMVLFPVIGNLREGLQDSPILFSVSPPRHWQFKPRARGHLLHIPVD